MSAQIIPFAEARARLRSTAPPAWAVYLAGLIFWPRRMCSLSAKGMISPAWAVYLAGLIFWPLACWLSLAELLKWGMGG